MDVAAFIRAQQQRTTDITGLAPAWTIWDPAVPDARVRDPKKRNNIWHRLFGWLSRIHCVSCGKKSPYASYGLEKTFYVCNKCTAAGKAPANAIMVPGTASL